MKAGGKARLLGLALILAALGAWPVAARATDDLRIVLQSDPNVHDWNEAATLSADGRFVVAVGSATGTITLWDVASGNLIDRIQLPVTLADNAVVGQPHLSPDNARISVDAFVKRAAPFTCRQIRYTYTLANGVMGSAVVATTPPGKAQGLLPAEQAICDGAIPRDAANASGDRVEVRSGVNSYALNPVPNNMLAVVNRAGDTVTLLSKNIPDQLLTAALSPDARYLAYVNDGDVVAAMRGMSPVHTVTSTTIAVLDLATGSFLAPIVIGGDSEIFLPRLAWRSAGQLLLSWEHPPHLLSNLPTPPAAQVLDVSAGGTTARVLPGRCLTIALPGGGFAGAGANSCLAKAAPEAALWVFDATAGWQPLDLPELAGVTIRAMVAAPDGNRIAVATEGAGLRVVDLATRRVVASTALTAGNPFEIPLLFLPGGRLIFATSDALGFNGRNWSWQPGQGDPLALAGDSTSAPTALFSDGTTLLTAQTIALARSLLANGAAQPKLAITDVIAGGFTQDGKLFWAASADDGLRFWHTADWSPAMRLALLDQQHFFALAPSGRYDTNLGPDTNAFRWLVRDAPLQSLASQTFMRDYFAPRLTANVLDGSEAGQPIPPILSLDRVLPQVRILRTAPGPTPATALVSLEVREGVNAAAANGKTRSGLYNLRLFRDDALIAQWPPADPAGDADLTQWRRDNALTPGRDGVVDIQAVVALPTGVDAGTVHFAAYAFNADRIKSDTAALAYTAPITPPRPRHAYVLTVGINRYREPRLQLQYAANDAQLLAQRLGHLPGYDVRQIVLADTNAAPAQPVTKAVIAAALDLLAGGDRAPALAVLKAAGIDGSPFAKATPDDLIIVTFSGHGWADPRGNFYLLPADAAWPDSAPVPQRATLISSAEITAWLRGIDAGAMALVIDACHSAASVATSGFKPGPMGDPGLGQLAYDKGIRILAATQSDDVAMEDAALKQGLLTYALAGEGIDAGGFGKADLNSDGRIMLDEWLRYALHRLPALSSDERLRHFGNGFAGTRHVTIISDTQALPPKPQDPALFDFNAAPSVVALRVKAS